MHFWVQKVKLFLGRTFYYEAFSFIFPSQVRVIVMIFNDTFNYIVAVSFIGGRIQSTQRKPPTCRKSQTNFQINWKYSMEEHIPPLSSILRNIYGSILQVNWINTIRNTMSKNHIKALTKFWTRWKMSVFGRSRKCYFPYSCIIWVQSMGQFLRQKKTP